MKTSLSKVRTFFESVCIPLRLSCKTESGWPYILSLWFLYQNEKIYCATQESSRVVAYLLNNPKCAFEVAADDPPYCGVRAQAIANVNKTLGVAILEQLLQRYLGGLESSLAKELLSMRDQEVAIVLDPVSVYKWDYSKRMQDMIAEKSKSKVCP